MEELELDLDELTNVAGGREINENEQQSVLEVWARFCKRKHEITDEAQIEKMKDGLYVALTKWRETIWSKPEGSEDILLSEFFDPDKY